MKKYCVMAPGPVNLHPKVLESLALPMIHHRTPEFDQILSEALAGLKKIFKTEEHCFILNSTGSGGMEALLVNVVNQNDQVAIIDSGKFGERWGQISEAYGFNTVIFKVEWGYAVDVDKLREFLKTNPQVRVLTCQACETSTGVAHPIKEIAALIKSEFPQICFLVDGITALGAYPIPMDEWAIDGLIGGSQKAFMLPTGLSFLSLSKKAWARVESLTTPKFYFDLKQEKKANLGGETYFSSNVTLVRALCVALKIIFQDGLDNHFATIQKRADFVRKFSGPLGLTSFSKSLSNSLSILSTGQVDGQKLRAQMENEFGYTLAGGQDQLKGKVVRIGHMGYLTNVDHINLMMNLNSCLKKIQNEESLRNYYEEMVRFWQT